MFDPWTRKRSFTRTLTAVEDATRRLQRGEAAHVAADAGGEAGRLAESFNAMAEAVDERQRRLADLAMRDDGTGLANRRALEAELAALAASREAGAMAAAVSIDRFETLSGAIGQELAAALLGDIAARLAERAPAAMIGVLGGDALGVIFHASGAEAALAAAHELVAALDRRGWAGRAPMSR
jgi:GGDEF domain-containing protein